MRYLVFLGLSLWVLGCDEEPPGPDPKPRTTDLIGVGVVEADNAEVWVLTQEVDRLEDVEPVGLDDSPVPPALAYYFQSITVKLHVANGQKFQSINGPEYENGVSYFYQKVADGYLTAGVGFGYCGEFDREWCLPTLSVRDDNNQLVRFAQLSCDNSYAFYQNWGEMHIWLMHIVELANGNLLFWGTGHTGFARLTCVTEYGEVMWLQIRQEVIDASMIAAMQYGGYAIVDQQNEVVKFYDDNGEHGQDIEFNRTDETRVKSIVQLANGNFICGGVNMTSNDPHLWYYNTDGTEVRDTTLYLEDCQDSVALYAVGDYILLAGFNGVGCSGVGTVRLMLVDSLFNVIGVESFGGNTHVVLKDVTVGADGSIYLCGAYDRGNGSYSALVTKYTSELDAVWSTTVHPTM